METGAETGAVVRIAERKESLKVVAFAWLGTRVKDEDSTGADEELMGNILDFL